MVATQICADEELALHLLVEISEKKLELINNILGLESTQATFQQIQAETLSYKNTKYSWKAQVHYLYHLIIFFLNKALYKQHLVSQHFSR